MGDEILAAFGARGETAWEQWRVARVPPASLVALARALPPGYRITAVHPPLLCAYPGEGPAATNAASYRDGGADGSGLTIAILDGGFGYLALSQAHGDAPATYESMNFTAEPIDAGTYDHGTNCVEVIYDYCPGAQYRLYKTATNKQWGPAVDDMIAHGVDILSLSVGSTGAGWPDNSGVVNQAVNRAADHGILVFCSVGNWARQHWEGTFTPLATDPAWHDFGGGDRYLQVELLPDRDMRAFLQWDNSGGVCDYDIYLYDAGLALLDYAAGGGADPEELGYLNQTGYLQTLDLSVRKHSGVNALCELYAIGCDWKEHIVPSGSNMAPANSTHPLVLAVGAVSWLDFASPNGSDGVLVDDSSQGPSNGGMVLPDLVAPTNTTVAWDQPNLRAFGATSGAAANAAGAAGAFYSADPSQDPYAVAWLLQQQALAWRDWGAAGADNRYGHGGIQVYEYASGTLWLARAFGNTGDLRAFPLYHVAAAQILASPGGRLVFLLGGAYPETVTLTTPLRFEAAAGMVTIGP
ncbi:MAG: S8 family serine peptidase [Krumholzibacteria bacterium]|nr:S8 family serine peptidase [Candidatus Krumholzibacteria bacterium]